MRVEVFVVLGGGRRLPEELMRGLWRPFLAFGWAQIQLSSLSMAAWQPRRSGLGGFGEEVWGVWNDQPSLD